MAPARERVREAQRYLFMRASAAAKCASPWGGASPWQGRPLTEQCGGIVVVRCSEAAPIEKEGSAIPGGAPRNHGALEARLEQAPEEVF